jgi:type I restriction enzyme, S subunit
VSTAEIPWMAAIPRHWGARRAKYLFRQSRLPPKEDDGVVTAFRDGQVTLRDNRRTDGFMVAEKEVGYQGVRRGQLVMHSMDAFAGAIGVSDSDGKCTPEYVVLDPRVPGIDPRFFAAVLREMARQRFIQVSCPSVRERAPRIRYSTFGDMLLPVPAADEQARIADFLEAKSTRVTAIIARTERLLELLDERHKALVEKAVTNGLHPQAAMKQSGCHWLGAIPSHWTVVRTRYLCSLTTGVRDTQDAQDDGAYPFFVRSDNVERIDSYSFDGEGVLTSGDGAGVGKVFHHYVGKLEFHQRVYLYYAFKRVMGRFFYYYLRENLAKVALAGNAKSTVDSLRRPMLLDFPVAVPPATEQQQIVKFLDAADEKHAVVRNKVVQQLGRLREYRQALINAAVTGQLDVAAQEAA